MNEKEILKNQILVDISDFEEDLNNKTQKEHYELLTNEELYAKRILEKVKKYLELK